MYINEFFDRKARIQLSLISKNLESFAYYIVKEIFLTTNFYILEKSVVISKFGQTQPLHEITSSSYINQFNFWKKRRRSNCLSIKMYFKQLK